MNLSYSISVIKLSAIMYFIACLQFGYAAYTQTITYTAKNESLETVLQAIKKQVSYEVLGTTDLLINKEPVSIVAKNMSLSAFLDKVLLPRKIAYRIVDRTIILEQLRTKPASTPSQQHEKPAQQIRSGRILRSDGTSLNGASIAIDGKTVAVADADGRFTLPAMPPGQSFTVTMVGYLPVTVSVQENKFSYTIQLKEEVAHVDEVVVTGYQVIKRDSYTGTAITKTGEELRQVSPQNLLQAVQVFDPSFKLLDNNLAGSNPNALPNINVRGASSLPSGSGEILRRDNVTGTTNMPAFILDGYEVNVQKVLDLDMTRIETVTLLKDAAATAIYGSRAANGVMVITTKTPKEGKLRVSYTHETNVNMPDLTEYNLLNATEKLEYERLAGLFDATLQQQPQETLDELYYQKLSNVLGGVDTYWLSQPLQTAVGQRHGLFLEGGSPVFRYGVDMRYQTRPGVMKGSSRHQYSGGLNFSYNLQNKIRFQNELAVTVVNGNESPYGSFSQYARMNPYYRMTDDNGNIIQQVDTWRRIAATGHGTNEFVLNPLYNATLNSFEQLGYTEVMNNLSGDFDLGNGLRLRGQVSLLKRMHTGDDFRSPLANQFFNYSTDRTNEKGSYTSYSNDELFWDANIRLNWLKRIGQHDFNVVAGTNIRTESLDERSFTAIGFPNDRFTSIGFARGYAENASPSSNFVASRLFGAFMSANYSFANKYLLDATIRADGSSKFGSNNRVAPFWSLGAGWNIHHESWFENSVINQLRLRATTGLTGSVQFAPYMSRTTYIYEQGNWYSSGVGAIVANYGNQNLSWQKTQNTDIGFDIALFSDRIMLSPRFYYRKTKDLLSDINLPPSTGFVSYKENLGDIENRGIEVNMNLTPVKTADWTVSFMANLVHNKNKIVRISNALNSYNNRVDEAQQGEDLRGVPLLRFKEGQSIDAIYAAPSLGIDPESGREVFVKQDGTLSYIWDPRDITVVGVATPKLEGSFGGTFRYKQFTAVVYFQTRLGGDMYNQTLIDRVENADPRYNVDRRVLEEKWQEPGDVTFFKSIRDYGKTEVSSRFVMPDNLLTLQSVFLSYDLQPAFAKKMSLSNLRLGLTANDILRFSSVEVERGINYPFARSISFSLQASL
ncbi:SusC/RagA family TonB-linked outer membrane protein [Sphingobacterium gobiense]|uniref:SusC/RagA family TonB-linked outer membrane protein n=1 Tax=Sphingobacterium gobiense TaxID=1382456 RepID=UPI001FE7AEFC|nr:SusC/RagA family TonB-linked outer membrane protein [Sphingobacterium gobiense]